MSQSEQQDVTPSPTKLRSRILVIDDGDSVRDIIGIFLENAGFEVCGEAADGVEGIEQAKKLKPDLPDRIGFGHAPDEWSGSCVRSQSNNAAGSDTPTHVVSKPGGTFIGIGYWRQGRSGQNRRAGQAGRVRSLLAQDRICT